MSIKTITQVTPKFRQFNNGLKQLKQSEEYDRIIQTSLIELLKKGF